ncbi:MAG: alpha/beta hydrolase family protein, partial [Humibacter sp.]
MNDPVEWHDGRIVEAPTWFGPDDRPLFGWLAYPEDTAVRGAVVICHAIGEEARSSRRTMRDLSRRLAEDGLLVLRFDYDGTGDSAGDYNDPAWTDRWAASVDEAVRFVQTTGVASVSLVGMRMGATIAAVAASGYDWAADAVVLWDPCRSGRDFLREQSMLHRAMNDNARETSDGTVVTPGYVFSEQAAKALAGLRAEDAAAIDTTRTRVTVAFRDDRPTPAALAATFESAGFSIIEVSGQAELLGVSPLDAQVPAEAMETVAGILSDAAGSERRAVRLQRRSEATLTTPWGSVTESFTAVGPDRLFGVGTRSNELVSDIEMVFLNVANEGHIGPARMWSELARQWSAQAGVSALRFDLGGLGDSPDTAGQPRDKTYLPTRIDEIDEAVDHVTARGHRVVLVGLCSSAYAALEGSLRKPVAGAIVTNPILDSIEMTMTNRDPIARDPRRKAYRRWPDPLVRLVVKHRRIAHTLRRAGQQLRPSQAAMGVVSDVLRRKAVVFLALGADDRHPFDVNWYWNLREPSLQRSRRFERVNIPELDHSGLVEEGRV